MANVVTHGKLPAPVRSRLAALRRKIALWMAVDGLSRVVLLLVVLGALDMGIVWVAKTLWSPMDFSQRLIMLVLILGALTAMFFWRLVRPFFSRIADDALCLEVEDAFDELGESLISSVQFSRMHLKDKDGVSPAMVGATIEQGVRAAQTVNFAKSLNGRVFAVNLILLLLGLAAIGGVAYGARSPEPPSNSPKMRKFLYYWYQRNVLLRNIPWPQHTYLVVEGVNDDGQIVMVRDERLKLVIHAFGEEQAYIPDEVTIEFPNSSRVPKHVERAEEENQQDGGAVDASSSINNVAARKPPTAKYTGKYVADFEEKMRDEIAFVVKGGDAETDQIKVILLDKPSVTRMKLTVNPPAYTGTPLHELPPGKGPYYVLSGSTVDVEGAANKPLMSAELATPTTTLPLKLRDGQAFFGTIATSDLEPGRYLIRLRDGDGLHSEATAFRLNSRNDTPPQVRAKISGITRKVVPQARIPMSVHITDDFSIDKAFLQYSWHSETTADAGGPAVVPFDLPDEQLHQHLLYFAETWDLRPLDLPAGIVLSFRIHAVDNDPITENKEPGKSTEIVLRVVTQEDLRTDILRREKQLREEFERLLEMQEALHTDVEALRADTTDVPEFDSDQHQELMRIQRRQKLVGTNTFSVATRFEAIVQEVENNRLEEDDDGPLKERLTHRIIEPLRHLAEEDVIQAVTSLDRAARLMENASERTAAFEATADRQEEIIEEMREILLFMVKAEGYQEAVNRLYEIEKAERNLREMTIKAHQEHQERIKKILEQGGTVQPQDGDSEAEPDNGGN